MLPTKIAKAKVFSTHDWLSIEKKSSKVAIKDGKREKLFKTKTPRTIPPKSDNSTFLVYNAKAMARIDGKSESMEVSMFNFSKFNR